MDYCYTNSESNLLGFERDFITLYSEYLVGNVNSGRSLNNGAIKLDRLPAWRQFILNDNMTYAPAVEFYCRNIAELDKRICVNKSLMSNINERLGNIISSYGLQEITPDPNRPDPEERLAIASYDEDDSYKRFLYHAVIDDLYLKADSASGVEWALIKERELEIKRLAGLEIDKTLAKNVRDELLKESRRKKGNTSLQVKFAFGKNLYFFGNEISRKWAVKNILTPLSKNKLTCVSSNCEMN